LSSPLFDLKTFGDIEKATFIERPNRFKAICEKDGKVVSCHVADPGRLKEIFIPGRKVLVAKHPPGMKTEYKLLAINVDDEWVLLNTSIHSKIGEEAIKRGVLGFRPKKIKREVRFGSSRIDYLLDDKIFVELKGTNLLMEGCCLFPDAPTERGARHLRELKEAIKQGYESYILFMGLRNCKCFKTHHKLDPNFSAEFKDALQKGVKFKGFKIFLDDNNLTVHLGEELVLCDDGV